MLRPWLGIISCVLGLMVVAVEVLVCVLFFTFVGLELCGIMVALFAVTHGLCGICTGKDDFPFQTRKNIFLLDYIASVVFCFVSFGMLCGSLLALSIYLYIILLLGTTPGVYEIMAFFGIPVVPILTLVTLKAVAVMMYALLFGLAIGAAISNRRNRPQ